MATQTQIIQIADECARILHLVPNQSRGQLWKQIPLCVEAFQTRDELYICLKRDGRFEYTGNTSSVKWRLSNPLQIGNGIDI